MSRAASTVRRVGDPRELTLVAAGAIVRHAQQAIRRDGRFTLALAGGSTPKGLYALMAGETFRDQVEWDKVHIFWGDERHVPPDHQDSNYRMAKEAMLSHLAIPPESIHRIFSELADASEAADRYEAELREQFQLQRGAKPRFDVILLGMGPDGHTASLFPSTSALQENSRLVVANWVEKFDTYRITLTAPVLNEAAQVIFLVSGHDKAEALQEVLEGEFQPEKYPAQLVQPTQGGLLWLVDQAAASALSKKP